jgi:hypothetical protein
MAAASKKVVKKSKKPTTKKPRPSGSTRGKVSRVRTK